MWFARTRLVPDDSPAISEEDRARMAPAYQRSEREDAVRAFALGDTSVDLAEFTDADAQFIDIYATVRKFRPGFRPEHILGLNPDGIVMRDGEGRGFGGTSISTFWLTKPATPRRSERRIVWTMTWHFSPEGQWILVGSHASAHE